MKDLFDKITVQPKTSLWIAIACLLFVLANNKIYLSSLLERERLLKDAEERVLSREASLAHREAAIVQLRAEILIREKAFNDYLKAQGKRP